MEAGECVVDRLGVVYAERMLIVQYRSPQGVFHKKFRLKRLNQRSNISAIKERLMKEIPALSEHTEQLDELLSRLMDHITDPSEVDPTPPVATDLNTVSDEELARAKKEMNVEFERNAVTPESSEYVYDKRVEFQQAVEPNDWDDDE